MLTIANLQLLCYHHPMDKKYLDEVVTELLCEMAANKVEINSLDGGIWKYPTQMDSKIENKKIRSKSKKEQASEENESGVILNIPNYDLFLEKISKYLVVAEKFYGQDKAYFMIDGKEYHKRLVLDLFLNATSFDLYEIYKYIDFKKKMLETSVPLGKFKLGEFDAAGEKLNIFANIRRIKFNMEAPYAFEVSFANSAEEFILPSVLFGASGNIVQIGAIQNLHKGQNSALKKKLDRLLRKIDSGIVKSGIDQIPYEKREIEQQVTINAVVSSAIFVNFFESMGVKRFVAPDFLPLRYTTKLNQMIENELKRSGGKGKAQIRHAVEEEMERTQFNMTNKFLYTFMRLALHFSNLKADYNPEENKIFVSVAKSEFLSNGNLLQQIVEATKQKKTQKQRQRQPKAKQQKLFCLLSLFCTQTLDNRTQ